MGKGFGWDGWERKRESFGNMNTGPILLGGLGAERGDDRGRIRFIDGVRTCHDRN